jgi:hypothetical protein
MEKERSFKNKTPKKYGVPLTVNDGWGGHKDIAPIG